MGAGSSPDRGVKNLVKELSRSNNFCCCSEKESSMFSIVRASDPWHDCPLRSRVSSLNPESFRLKEGVDDRELSEELDRALLYSPGRVDMSSPDVRSRCSFETLPWFESAGESVSDTVCNADNGLHRGELFRDMSSATIWEWDGVFLKDTRAEELIIGLSSPDDVETIPTKGSLSADIGEAFTTIALFDTKEELLFARLSLRDDKEEVFESFREDEAEVFARLPLLDEEAEVFVRLSLREDVEDEFGRLSLLDDKEGIFIRLSLFDNGEEEGDPNFTFKDVKERREGRGEDKM